MFRTLTLDEIAEVTGGAVVDGPDLTRPGSSGEEVVTAVSTDTRSISEGALFVALRGEKRDGHAFLKAAADAGAAAFLTDRSLREGEPHLPHVVVADTLHAFGDIARDLRDDFKGPVVGVTGSVGKTTTKEMIAEILATTFQVHKSAANHNNEIGVPQTIFEMNDTHNALVVEMGMRGLGEIRRLCEIAAPTIGVITGIGASHIERLGSREKIAEAKTELLELLPSDGVAVFPATDEFASKFYEKFAGTRFTVAVAPPAPINGGDPVGIASSALTPVASGAITPIIGGRGGLADVVASEVTRHENGYRFTVTSPWGTQKFFLPSPGEFNVQNSLLAIAVGGALGIPLDTMARALLRWKAPAMRLEILTGKDGVTILSDAYNAAPDSMVGALKTLRGTPVGQGGKRIAILGEMRELGVYADEGHVLVGRAVATLAAPDMLVLIGPLTRKIGAGALLDGFKNDAIHYFESTDEAIKLVPMIVQGTDAVLIKGSRAMAMERIVEALGGTAESPGHASVSGGAE